MPLHDQARQSSQNHAIRQFGDIHVDLDGHLIQKSGMEIRLTALEFDLLKYF